MYCNNKMTMVCRARIAGLVGITLFVVLFTGSAAAEYEWSNNITLTTDGMQWLYTENISGMDASVFKYDIDDGHGNKDDFVSTWELMKADKYLRDRLSTAIREEMDVRIDSSSEGVKMLDVDASLCEEALGTVWSQTGITNTYIVTYRFDEGLLVNGSTIWFLGEPGSTLTVSFPDGTQILSSSGIDNVSITQSYLSGRFKEELNKSVKPDGAEITYKLNQTPQPDTIMHEETEDNDSTIPEPTEIPFPTGVNLLVILAAAALLQETAR